MHTSDSEFILSDQQRGPAELRERSNQTLVVVDSSSINRNESNQTLRNQIYQDEKEYQVRKALPYEWLEVLQSLPVIGPKRYLSEKVICNYLLDCWWALRFSPQIGATYLPFSEVNQLSHSILTNQPTLLNFQSGVFKSLYRSVISTRTTKRVCFFLHRNLELVSQGERDTLARPNHFFPVVFNYDTHEAFVFGAWSTIKKKEETRIGKGQESRWDAWLGSDLWRTIGHQLDWSNNVGDPAAVTVTIKNWHQVGLQIFYLLLLKKKKELT